MKVKGYKKHILVLTIILTLLSALSFIALNSNIARAQVPITVWGYVKYPNGRPAAGAHVRVVADGASKSTTTDSSGKYKVDLTVSKVPVTVRVYASINSYKGSASKSNVKGVVRIDVTLHKVKKSTSLKIWANRTVYTIGERAKIYGKITPPIRATIVIHIIDPTGREKTAKIQSKGDGSFTYSFTVDKLGKWKVYASFPGTADYYPSRSNTLTIYVKTGIKIEFNVEYKVLNMTAIKLEIFGNTDPPVSGTKLTLFLSFDRGLTWMKIGETPLNNGIFNFTYIIHVIGEILVKVYFPGTEKYAPCEVVREVIIRAANITIPEFEKKIKELRTKAEQLKSQMEALKKEREELIKVKAELEESTRRMQKEVENLRKQLQTLNETLNKLLKENAALKEKIEYLKANLTESEKAKKQYVRKLKKTKTLMYVSFTIAFALGFIIGYIVTYKWLSRKILMKHLQYRRQG